MWPFGGTKQENGEFFSGFMPEHIDLVKRSKPNTQLPLDESIGEIVCDKCNGWGNLYSKGDERHIIRCNKCWGVGKLDWIEKAVGKKEVVFGTTGSSFFGT